MTSIDELKTFNTASSCAIVMPVYSHYELALRSAQSIVRHGVLSEHRKLIIADDCSPDYSQEVYEAFTAMSRYVQFIRNETNLGFVKNCNAVVESLQNEYKYVLLINSDVVCTEHFLDEMIATADRDDRIGLVNPICNNAANLSVEIPSFQDINSFADFLRQTTFSGSTDVVTIVGFCMLMRSAVIKHYGLFDEVYGAGYCEETDLHFRLTANGIRSVICPKAFVYHVGSASFVDRDERFEQNVKILMSRYKVLYDNQIAHFDEHTILNDVRQKLRTGIENVRQTADVLCIVPDEELSGGVKALNQFLNSLVVNGYRVVCYIESSDRNTELEHLYGTIQRHTDLNLLVQPPTTILCSYYTTFYTAIRLGQDIYRRFSQMPHIGFFLQDNEGHFEGASVTDFATVVNARDFSICVSEFVKSCLPEQEPTDVCEPIGINTDVFYPINKSQDKFIITAMLRNDRKRNAKFIVNAFKALEEDIVCGRIRPTRPVEIITFGKFKDIQPGTVTGNIPWTHMGSISEPEVAKVLQGAHLFIEASVFQGFGLPAYEALACGCDVALSNTSGSNHYSSRCFTYRINDLNGLTDLISDYVCRGNEKRRVEDTLSGRRIPYSLFEANARQVAAFENILTLLRTRQGTNIDNYLKDKLGAYFARRVALIDRTALDEAHAELTRLSQYQRWIRLIDPIQNLYLTVKGIKRSHVHTSGASKNK